MVPSVLQLLIDELHDIRRSVKSVKKDVSRVSSHQASLTDMQHRLVQTLDALTVSAPTSTTPSHWSTASTAPPMPLASSALASYAQDRLPHLTESARAARLQFVRQFPFLERYNLDKRDAPFVVDDLGKPMSFARVMPDAMRRRLPVPIIVYANPAMCELLGYELYELQGCGIDKVSMPDEGIKARVIALLTHRTDVDMTGVLHFACLFRTKSDAILRAEVRWQAFLDSEGNALWSIICVDKSGPARNCDIQTYASLSLDDPDNYASSLLFPTASPPFSTSSPSPSPSPAQPLPPS